MHERVHDLLPDARLLVVLRDPVTRAVSAVQHIVRSGRVSPLHSIDDLLVGPKAHLVEGHGVLSYGDYAEQLEQWLELYPPEQLVVLIYEEDVVENPERGLARACAHLGVDAVETRRRRAAASTPASPRAWP